MRNRAKFRADQSNRCADIAIFGFFVLAASAILDLLNFKFVTVRTVKKDRTASPRQISSKSLKPRPIYGDFSNFQYGGRRHIPFLKLQI